MSDMEKKTNGKKTGKEEDEKEKEEGKGKGKGKEIVAERHKCQMVSGAHCL